jgi:two-component system cell cycle sensor histidine kinase/response regulator CckA
VISAASPIEAVGLFDRHEHEIGLLVTDVVMPEMRGPVLADRLLARRPDLRVLFMSGYSDVPVDLERRGTQAAFLEKPFTPSGLVAAVAALRQGA